MASSQAENSKKVLERFNEGSDKQLKSMCLAGWTAFLVETKKEQDMAALQAEAEKKMAQFMEEKAETAKKVMQALFGASESGCMKNAFDEWVGIVQELKREAEMEQVLAQQKASLNEFS